VLCTSSIDGSLAQWQHVETKGVHPRTRRKPVSHTQQLHAHVLAWRACNEKPAAAMVCIHWLAGTVGPPLPKTARGRARIFAHMFDLQHYFWESG